MDIKNVFTNFLSEKKNVFRILSWALGIGGLFIALNLLFPALVAVILNIIWVVLLSIVLIFFGLGLLVILGMKKDVNRILDILLEGSLTLIDFVNFVRELWKRFRRLLREFLIYSAPILAGILAVIIYVALLLIYKTVGRVYDVTLLTIGITVVLVVVVEILNRNRPSNEELGWVKIFKEKFHNTFADAFEVVLFIFFLTMDSDNLFFLPQHLNVPLRAQVLDYDFMKRGFAFNDHLKVTATLIMIAVSSEIARYAIKVVRISIGLYRETRSYLNEKDLGSIMLRTSMMKDSLRRGFVNSKDDTIKFITFNTVLILVFLLFPRLKLLGMCAASLTGLFTSIFLPRPNVSTRQVDLVSRVLSKAFRL